MSLTECGSQRDRGLSTEEATGNFEAPRIVAALALSGTGIWKGPGVELEGRPTGRNDRPWAAPERGHSKSARGPPPGRGCGPLLCNDLAAGSDRP